MMPPTLQQYLRKAGIQVDIMNTVSRPPPLTPVLSFSTRPSEMHVQHITSLPRKGDESRPLCYL